MGNERGTSQKASTGRLFLPSLIIAIFTVSMSTPIVTLLTVDIASTFQVPTGIAAQLSTVTGFAEVLFALLLGFLAVKFKHKSLLLMGISLVVLASIGSFFSPNISSLQFFFFVEGVGTTLVSVMTYTILGDSGLSQSGKAKAVSYVVAVASMATLVGTPVIGAVTNIGGWRSIFLIVLPISIIGLALAFKNLPDSKQESTAISKQAYFQGFKQILRNKSAIACLLGGMLRSASAVVPIFAVAFYRERFAAPRDLTVGIILLAASTYVIVSLLAGRLAERVDPKKLAAAGTLGVGILVINLFFMPSLWLAITLDILQVCFGALSFVGFNCLALDQISNSRSTMMSMKAMFLNLGGSIGAAIAGAVLILFSYEAVGIALGSLCMCSAAVFYFFTKTPPSNEAFSR